MQHSVNATFGPFKGQQRTRRAFEARNGFAAVPLRYALDCARVLF